jgi:hypothetical protein
MAPQRAARSDLKELVEDFNQGKERRKRSQETV